MATCAAGGGVAAAVCSGASGLRISTQASAIMFTPNNTASPTAQTGNRRRGAATLTSNRAGEACRWRSVSDFFRASRMKDMSATALQGGGGFVQERRGGVVERSIQRHLGLHAGDAVDRQAVAALELLDQRHQRSIEAVVGGVLGGQAVDTPQAVAQPLHAGV